MKQGLEIGGDDGIAIELDIGPGAPRLKRITVGFEVNTPAELEHAIKVLGFDPLEMEDSALHMRFGLPVTLDGVKIASATVELWLGEALAVKPEKLTIPALQAIRAAAKRAKVAHEASPEDVDDAVEYAMDVERNA
jgi:hypothetical protein